VSYISLLLIIELIYLVPLTRFAILNIISVLLYRPVTFARYKVRNIVAKKTRLVNSYIIFYFKFGS
jgi:hypothetical protein